MIPTRIAACVYRNGESCSLVQKLTQLDIKYCTVSDLDCRKCQNQGVPDPNNLTKLVLFKVMVSIRKNAPDRFASFVDRYPEWGSKSSRNRAPARVHEDALKKWACIHRSDKPIRVGKCAPCKGGDVNVYDCKKLKAECTVHVRKKLVDNWCVFCEHREEEPLTELSLPEKKSTGLVMGSWNKSQPQQKGWLKTQYGQSADNMWGKYRGSPVFLVAGGPTLNSMDLSILNQRGIMTAAVNQVAATHIRPDIWFSVDPVHKFHPAIFSDPAITKFVRFDRMRDGVRDADLERTQEQCRRFPDVYFYNCQMGCGVKNSINPARFLTCDTPVWGGKVIGANGKKTDERKSVMLSAIWTLYWLGFRTIFLVGTTFSMRPEEPYAFEMADEVKPGYCGGNNASFRQMKRWFKQLRPEFEKLGLRVYNCTEKTKLVEFERCTLHNAVSAALDGFPVVKTVKGLY